MIKLIDYETFGRLRFLEFFPKVPPYSCDDVGGIMTSIGYSCVEGYAETAFAWRIGPKCTGGINLEFGNECPSDLCRRLLETIGLPLREGMTLEQVRLTLGVDPNSDHSSRFARFVLGERDKYYVSCAFNNSGGLYRVGVARKDLTDKNNEEMGI